MTDLDAFKVAIAGGDPDVFLLSWTGGHLDGRMWGMRVNRLKWRGSGGGGVCMRW